MRHWRLTIDIREIDSDYTAVIFSLFNWDNSKMLRHVKRVEREMVSDWVRRAKGCFMDTDRRGLGRELAVLAEDLSRDLELPSTVNKWFQSPLLDTNSTLLIDSLHTNIPWDLLPTGSSHGGAWSGEYLGHKFAIGLQVPTVDADYFFSTQPSGRPRADPREAGKPIFLHVLANPRNDLRTLEMESEKLKEVVEKTGWLDYKAVQEASWGKLVRLISAYGPAIRYFHYSGHVRPKEGLVLSASEGRRPRENLFSIQAIRSRLAGTSLDIAFLNGCDETYVDVDEKGFSSWNPHDHANVANSFLEAGANGVVAPRSRISDEDAPEAAEMIWSAIFSGKVLGAAVQEYRQKKIGDFPDSIAGYSYVVYGNPGVLVMPEATPAMPSAAPVAGYITEAQPSDPFEGWRLRAEAECGREVGPAQLFAAFTRTWMVGSAFFEALGQAYIQALMDLRLKLGVPERTNPRATTSQAVPTPQANKVFSRAMAMLREDPDPDPDICLFRALAMEPGSRVQKALADLKAGRNLGSPQELWRAAEMWRKNGSPVPATAVLPGGQLCSERFLPDLRFVREGTDLPLPRPGTVNNGDLFAALLAAGGRAGEWWSLQDLPLPERPSWLGGGLDVYALSKWGQEVVLCAAKNMEFEEASRVNEPRFIEAVCGDVPLEWDELPPDFRASLLKAGKDGSFLKSTCERLLMLSRGW